jgi:hypothetical protein
VKLTVRLRPIVLHRNLQSHYRARHRSAAPSLPAFALCAGAAGIRASWRPTQATSRR